MESEIFLFADDTKVYSKTKKLADRKKLQRDLDRLQTWSDKWLLKFHPDKCKVLRVNKKIEEPLDFSLSPNNKKHPLAEATTEKDIGVTFDGQLSFDEHINSKVKTANMMAGLIRRSYKFLTVKTFLPLYKSLVRVHFDYATSVWSPHLQKTHRYNRRSAEKSNKIPTRDERQKL